MVQRESNENQQAIDGYENMVGVAPNKPHKNKNRNEEF